LKIGAICVFEIVVFHLDFISPAEWIAAAVLVEGWEIFASQRGSSRRPDQVVGNVFIFMLAAL
jgi:hypothetical protein